jgi:hypothetical protein
VIYVGVRFISVELKSTYLALENKDSSVLYWITETSELFKGDQLFGVGALASEQAAGLLSAEDYVSLKALIASSGTTGALVPVDGSLIIKDNTIDIGISAEPGNALIKKTDGLYVGTSTSGNYAAGSGLQLVDGTFSIKLTDNTHGLVAVDGALSLSLATKDSDGAMSKEDKAFLDILKELNISSEYATKDEVQILRESVARVEWAYTWEEL